jgi:tetratricopeptide (TPR) repeat protein
MEPSRKQVLEQAQALEKRGSFEAAAQAYVRAGSYDDAVRLYLAGGKSAEAGQVLLRSIDYEQRRSQALDAAGRKIALKAAICFSKAGDVRQAVELFLAVGERGRAIQFLQERGDFANAARLQADPTGRVSLMGYDRPAAAPIDVSNSLDIAQNLERAGKLESALEAYTQGKHWAQAGRLAQRLGRKERAASYFAEAGQAYASAECWRELGDHSREPGDRNRELEQLLKVPAADAHYRAACLRVIAIAVDRGELSFELEHFLNRFVTDGPKSDEEIEPSYRLALLFDTHGFPENAAMCYRKILALRPGYRDAADRLRAAETDYRGASAKDYERAFKEELAFRAAVGRHETKTAPVAPQSEPDASELPDLPDLPDLPALPAPPPAARPTVVPTGTRAFKIEAEAVPEAVSSELTWGPGAVTSTGLVLEPGVTINERYRLERKLGQGGIGVVWKAQDLELDEAVAIKFVAAQLVDEETLGRFKQEVSLSRQFNHPNIIRMYDIGTCAGHKYISMELLRGRDLGVVMRESPLELQRGLGLLVQACQALQVVHNRGVIHRDIKPDNFFITDEGVLKVMDFGIAKHHNARRGLTKAGMMAGTPQFIAPEQINNFGGVTHLADLYALGCIAYQMFTGSVPFDADEVMPILMAHMTQAPEPPRQRNPAIPAPLEAVILKLLSKQPEARVQSCQELAGILLAMRRPTS